MSQRYDPLHHPQDDSAHWAEFGRIYGQAFAAGIAYANTLTSQHTAVQEAQAERRIGRPRPATQVVIGKCMEVDENLLEMKVNTDLGGTVWAFFGNSITKTDAQKMASRRQKVRLTVPTNARGSHQAFYSGEMVDPSTEA